jgi:DNA-binding transcriptional regulator GbsR (MarR family)
MKAHPQRLHASPPPRPSGEPLRARTSTPDSAPGEASAQATAPSEPVAPTDAALSVPTADHPTGHPHPQLEEQLAQQLPTFEHFFKTFGFKRIHGRIWGLLVLVGTPLSAKDISHALALSQGATSTAINELLEWGAITSEFDPARRCHLHAPVSNTLSIVATVIRRREQVAFQQFRVAAARTLAYVSQRYGERDPRVLTLRSIISTCEIAEAVMQLVVGAVANALDDSQSILHKAVSTALKVGMALPGRLPSPAAGSAPGDATPAPPEEGTRG